MKTIEDKQTGIKESLIKFKGSEETTVKYSDLIALAIDIVPQGGFTVTDVEKRIRIKHQLKEVKDGKMQFEDSDFEALKGIIKNSRWVYYDEELNDFFNQFK